MPPNANRTVTEYPPPRIRLGAVARGDPSAIADLKDWLGYMAHTLQDMDEDLCFTFHPRKSKHIQDKNILDTQILTHKFPLETNIIQINAKKYNIEIFFTHE